MNTLPRTARAALVPTIGPRPLSVPLLQRAARYVLTHPDTVTRKKLQEGIGVGEETARKLLARLADWGVVGPIRRARVRRVYLTAEHLPLVLELIAANNGRPPYRNPLAKLVKPVLTDRQLEVLRLVAEGGTPKSIAARLYLATDTVQMHLAKARDALGAANTVHAVHLAHCHGLLGAAHVEEEAA